MNGNEKYLFLIRHEKAEERGAKPDAERALTPDGIARLHASLPGIRKYLERGLPILSSPFVRARETADPIAESLGSKVEIAPWIADGDRSGLRALTTRSNSVAVVGHEPYLSEWIRDLTHETVTVKKGSVTCLRQVAGDAKQWELLWYRTAAELAEDDL